MIRGAREFIQDAASSYSRCQKDAVLDVSSRRFAATEEDQEHLNFLEDLKLCEWIRPFKKFGNRRQSQNLAAQSPNVNRLRTAHGEGFLNFSVREVKVKTSM